MKKVFSFLICLIIGLGFLFGNLNEMESFSGHYNKTDSVQSDSSHTIDFATDVDEDCSDCGDSSHCSHHCNGLHIVLIPSTLENVYAPVSTDTFQEIQDRRINPFLKVAEQPPQFLLI